MTDYAPSVEREFDAGHDRVELFESCRHDGHGHHWRVRVTVRGIYDPRDGRSYRINELDFDLGTIVAELEGKNLSKMMPGALPTPEGLGLWILERLVTAGPAAQVLAATGSTLKPEVFGRALDIGVHQLAPNSWNPNVQDEATFRRELASIRRFGFVDPIVCRHLSGEMYEIIDGEHRWKAAKDEGLTEIGVNVLHGLSDTAARKLTLQLNIHGQADSVLLGKELTQIHDLLGDDTLLGLPWDAQQFADLLALASTEWPTYTEGDDPGATDGEFTKMVFDLPPHAAEVVEEALAKAIKAGGSEHRGLALERICADYLAGE